MLFWVGKGVRQGVLITGVDGYFRPITLEIIRRTMSGPGTFRRVGIIRALDIEATLRDRPLCRWDVPGYVQTRDSFSTIRIHRYSGFVRLMLGVIWWRWNKTKGRLGRLDFTATGCVDRFRAEAAGTGFDAPPVRNYVFGAIHGSKGVLHLGPSPDGIEDVVSPEQWEGRKIQGRGRERHGQTWMLKLSEAFQHENVVEKHGGLEIF